MASAASTLYISVVLALLSVSICVGQNASSNAPTPGLSSAGSIGPFILPPSPANTPAPTPAPAPTRSRAPAPTPVPAASAFDSPDSTRHRQARNIGFVFLSFAVVLQGCVFVFLLVKRRQMLKHLHGAHSLHDPPHMWFNSSQQVAHMHGAQGLHDPPHMWSISSQ